MNTNEKFFREYGNLILPEIGEVSIMVQGDEFKKPHFHVYDHKNKIGQSPPPPSARSIPGIYGNVRQTSCTSFKHLPVILSRQ